MIFGLSIFEFAVSLVAFLTLGFGYSYALSDPDGFWKGGESQCKNKKVQKEVKRMVIKAKEFKFRGDKITCQPTEYTINWCDFIGEPTVTISRLDGTFSNKQLKFSAKDIPLFIKELQTLTEFMKNDGLLVEDEEEEAKDEDRGCGSDHQPG